MINQEGWYNGVIAGNANAMYDAAPTSAFEKHPASEAYVPVPGDAVVFGGGEAGHIAIVEWVDASHVGVVEQNASSSGRSTLSFSNGKIGSEWGLYVIGVLHARVNSAAGTGGTPTFDEQDVVERVNGDFNGDGRSDIAVLAPSGSGGSEVWVGLSNGSTFTDAGRWWTNASWGSAGLKLATGDFNGDGRSDIAVLAPDGSGGSAIWVALSNGSNGFTDAGRWWTNSSWSPAGLKLATGDFNGDGRSDIAVLAPDGSGGSAVWVALSNGSNGFTDAGRWWTNASWGSSGLKLATGDFNGDGRSDIALLTPDGSSPSEVWVGLSNGASAFTNAGLWWSNKSWPASGVKLATGDFNGDGRTDIALLTPYGSSPSEIWVGLSNGSLFNDGGQWWSSKSWGASGLKVAPGDFNGDGRSDIAVLAPSGSGGSEIWVDLSNGAGTFTDAGQWWSNPSWGPSGLQLG